MELITYLKDNGLLSDYNVWFSWSYLLLVVEYWILSGIYLLLDYYLPTNLLIKYKHQPNKLYDKLLWKRYKHAALLAITAQLTGGFCCMAIFGYLIVYYGKNPNYYDPFPDIFTIIVQLAIIVIVEEIGFYSFHRLFHTNKTLFKYIHSIHHEFDSPVAVAATATHPIEHFVVNVSPLMLGVLLSGCHYYIAIIWWSIATINTCNTHSGYNFFSRGHDYHHQIMKCNYGVFNILDKYCQTSYQDVIQKEIANGKDS